MNVEFPIAYDEDGVPEYPCASCIDCYSDRIKTPCSDCVLSYEKGGTHWKYYKEEREE